MPNRFKIAQIIGVALLLAGLAGQIYGYFSTETLRISGLHFFTLMIIGMLGRASGEVGTLRARHADKKETMTKNDIIIAVISSLVIAGALICLAK